MINLITALLLAAATPEAASLEAPASASPTATADKPAPAAPAVQQASVADSKPRLICWDEAPTGTRFTHKVCATKEQLEMRRRDDQNWKMMARPVPAAGR
jgi:hypothetical protein